MKSLHAGRVQMLRCDVFGVKGLWSCLSLLRKKSAVQCIIGKGVEYINLIKTTQHLKTFKILNQRQFYIFNNQTQTSTHASVVKPNVLDTLLKRKENWVPTHSYHKKKKINKIYL